MNNQDIENHMILGNRDEAEMTEEMHIEREVRMRTSAESVVLDGDLDEIIEGETREYWLENYHLDTLANNIGFIANIFNRNLDAYEAIIEVNEIAVNEIYKQMLRDLT